MPEPVLGFDGTWGFEKVGGAACQCFINIQALYKRLGYFIETGCINENNETFMKTILCLLAFSIVFFSSSCQYNADTKDEAINLTDTISTTGLTGDSVKLVKTADIRLKVNDVTQSTKALSELVKRFGGMIYDQNMTADEGTKNELKFSDDSLLVVTTFSPKADVLVNVPSARLEDFMYEVADLGYFTGSSALHIDDKSLRYLENELRQQNRAAFSPQSKPILKRAATIATIKAIKVRDEVVEQLIENRAIDAAVRYSTMHLALFQNPIIRKEVVADKNVSNYQLPFAKQLGNALKDGWQAFLTFLLALARLWMFVLLGILCFAVWKYMHSKAGKLGWGTKTI